MAKPIVFEPEFVEALRTLFEETHRLQPRARPARSTRSRPGSVDGSLAMRPELIGHSAHQRLHGGVISASLDAMAGLAIIAAIGARHMDEPPAQRMHRFAKLGTIDLRIDYLRPAIGDRVHARRPRCCASARASPRRGWTSATPPASCSPAAPRPTSSPRPERRRRRDRCASVRLDVVGDDLPAPVLQLRQPRLRRCPGAWSGVKFAGALPNMSVSKRHRCPSP